MDKYGLDYMLGHEVYSQYINYEIKLSDFGTSKQSKNTITNTFARGTTSYLSPELLELSTGSQVG